MCCDVFVSVCVKYNNFELCHVQYQDCSEVRQLCKIAAQELAEPLSLSQLESMMTQPLVVVEGMDATGECCSITAQSHCQSCSITFSVVSRLWKSR